MLWQRAQIFISGSLNAEAMNPRTAGKPDHLVVYYSQYTQPLILPINMNFIFVNFSKIVNIIISYF